MTNQNPDTAATAHADLTMPEHVRLFKEALDVPEPDAYSFQDLLDVAAGEVKKKHFGEWVVARFIEEGEAGVTFEVADSSRPAGTMVEVEKPSVWETWNMQPLTAPRSIASLVTMDGDQPFVRMQKYTADDRGPGSYGPVLAFPLDVLFGERKRNEEYAEYLRLKAMFEPDASTGADGADDAERMDSDDENATEHKAQTQARATQVLGLGGSLDTGYVGPSESDRQP